MPLQATSGAASYDAFGGGVAAVPNYIEECFSTTLYTGNGSTQTITNGIDLAGKGGLVWIKERTRAGTTHDIYDTARGVRQWLAANESYAQILQPAGRGLTAFNADGFTVGQPSNGTENSSGQAISSWTFREQPKFFDVVTYTGDGGARNIAHNLGSVPGCIIIKRTDQAADWVMYHRSTGNTQGLYLNTTDAAITSSTFWENTTPTSTTFRVGVASRVNAAGGTYVAYLFAHNAGGFGLTGTDNVISCGSFTSNSDGSASVNLGYEPQFLLYKRTDSTGDWILLDTMRGFSQTSGAMLRPNTSGAEQVVSGDLWNPTATGFIGEPGTFGVSTQNIYIAIRRGPMRVPTTGTSVFSPIAAANSTATQNTTGFPIDLQISKLRNTGGEGPYDVDRLRGVSTNNTGNNARNLITSSTGSEGTDTNTLSLFWNNTGFQTPNYYGGSDPAIYWNFRRAPGFFDEVCYTGNGTAGRTITHNLTVAPEMMIVKARDFSGGRPWPVYHIGMGNTKFMYLNTTDAEATNTWWNDTTPTASVFTVGSNSVVNFSGTNYVAYLFASCPGVSKVGSFTGTGATQVINCGFTGGARFVLIKATSTTGNWLVWDSARGIVSGNDPYLLLNSTAAEVTNTDWVDTAATGFELSNAGGNLANSNGVSYVFLAIS